MRINDDMMNERNRETLQWAIRQLPVYQPTEALWHQLEAVLPLEDEPDLLTAPVNTWDKIDEELQYHETERNRNILKEALAALPVYQAPQSLWQGLKDMLGESETAKQIPLWRQMANRAAAVAAVLILFSAAFWIQATYEQPLSIGAEEAVFNDVKIDSVELIAAEGVLKRLILMDCFRN